MNHETQSSHTNANAVDLSAWCADPDYSDRLGATEMGRTYVVPRAGLAAGTVATGSFAHRPYEGRQLSPDASGARL